MRYRQNTRDTGKTREIKAKYDVYIDKIREIQAEHVRFRETTLDTGKIREIQAMYVRYRQNSWDIG